MLDDRRRSEIEQESQFICEAWTTYLRNYHDALIRHGFTPSEALTLTVNLQEHKLIGKSR